MGASPTTADALGIVRSRSLPCAWYVSAGSNSSASDRRTARPPSQATSTDCRQSARQPARRGASTSRSQPSAGASSCSCSARNASATLVTSCCCVKKPPPVSASKSCSANACTSGQSSIVAAGPLPPSSAGGSATPTRPTPLAIAMNDLILCSSTCSTSSSSATGGDQTCSLRKRATRGCSVAHSFGGAYRRAASAVISSTASSSALSCLEPQISRPLRPEKSQSSASREPAWFRPSTPPTSSSESISGDSAMSA